jgi:molecular chaperone DnaK (HSP70)
MKISGHYLRYLKDLGNSHLEHPTSNAIISVPSCFNEQQRNDTMKAAEFAGLNVLSLVTEPTSAAIAFEYMEEDRNKMKARNVFVFDLEAGTLDVTFLRAERLNYEVLAVSGDSNLGRRDWVNRLLEWSINKFKAKRGIDLSRNPEAIQPLLHIFEETKKSLTQRISTRIVAKNIKQEYSLDERICREEFEEISKDLFDVALFLLQMF